MKNISMFIFTLLLSLTMAHAKDIIYEADHATNFPNPERGYCHSIDPPFANMTWSFCEQDPAKYTDVQWTKAMNLSELKFLRSTKGMSLVLVRYHIAEFRYKPLSEDFLARLRSDFATIRNAKFKMIPHFSYNWVGGGPDAPSDIILGHLEQLRPIFHENADVIAYVYSGLIGCWGEQHSSAFGNIDIRKGYNRLNDKFISIINKLFDVVPQDRMVNFRIAQYKFQYFNGLNNNAAIENTPIENINDQTAYNGSIRSRWGTDEHCLVCSECHCGSYIVPGQDPKDIVAWLERENKYVPQGGEPGVTNGCGSGAEDIDGDGLQGNDERDDCERIRTMFTKHKWSTINENFNWNVDNKAVEKWRVDGCYNDFAKLLGYRFRVAAASIPERIDTRDPFSASLTIVNDGYASCYNKRGIALIFRNKNNGTLYTLEADNTVKANDPRFWFGGETHHVTFTNVQLPDNMITGEYEVLLSLYDPYPSLRDIPEYAIRLANKDVWESSSGLNKLNTSILINNIENSISDPLLDKNNFMTIYSPNNKTFSIELLSYPILKVDFIDQTGRVVYHTTETTNNISFLPNGVYHIRIQTIGGVVDRKIFKN